MAHAGLSRDSNYSAIDEISYHMCKMFEVLLNRYEAWNV